MNLHERDAIPGERAQELLRRLTSRYVGERVAAQQELERMGPEAIEILLEFLRAEATRRERKRRIFRVALTGGLGLAGSLAFILLLNGRPELLGILGAFGGLGGLSALLVPSQQQMEAVNVLARMDDPRALGPLIEGLAFPDMRVQTACTRALMNITPNLQPEDGAQLTPTHFATLHRILKTRDRNRESDFLVTLLDLLTRLEDVSALPEVAKLAEADARTTEEQQVQGAANQSRIILKECAERLKTTQTLLRASTMPAASPETLLRPAQSATASDPQQLLRAGASDEEA
jgi:hypothetical protein